MATGSVRRRAQLGLVRPDLRFIELRGNIATRLGRIPDDGAIVMAGQGCVALEVRADDEETTALLASIDDPSTRHAVEVERAFLAELGAGCSLPVGAHAAGGRLHTFLASSDREGHHVDVIVASDDIELTGDDGDLERARAAARAAKHAVGWEQHAG